MCIICLQFQGPVEKPSKEKAPTSKESLNESSTGTTQESLHESSTGAAETDWPVLVDNGKELLTQFAEGSWKCPFCPHWTVRIKQHLKIHSKQIERWEDVEKFCAEVSKWKRKLLEQKRGQDPKRKETLSKADKKRSQDLQRQREDPKRKETLLKAGKKADEKRAQDRKRRVQQLIAQGKYKEKIGNIRRRAQNRRYKQTQVDKKKGGDALMRRTRFLKAVLRGPEYVCSSCHRTLFKKSVTAVTDFMRDKIKRACEDSKKEKPAKTFKEYFDKAKEKMKSKEFLDCKEFLSSKEFLKLKLKKTKKSPEPTAFDMWRKFMIRSGDNFTYLCSTCKEALSAGRMPSMAVANGLELDKNLDRPRLTELENNLVAQVINFQKIVVLKKSCWPAGKGKMICVPVPPDDLMNTVKQLPRLPEEAGLVPIKLKRKKEYKGYEKSELIRPEVMFRALRYLRERGHPYYQFFDDEETYMARCRQLDRLKLLTGEDARDELEEDLDPMKTAEVGGGHQGDVVDEAVDEDEEEIEDLEGVIDQEEEDIVSDPVRRQHFKYNEYSTLVNGHPEIFLDDDGKRVANLDFAPAEGKIPTSFLNMKDWDTKSWPTLLPDGKFGRDHKRTVKLTNQNYFQQRLLNVDERFAKTPGWVFGAMSHVEAERLRNNANLTGFRGKRSERPGGQMSYVLNDPLTVFDKIKGTPRYWQTVKFEMIAKLENLGPFHIFFTLSCADMRWSSNFTPVLEKMGCKLSYEVDEEGHEHVTVEVVQGGRRVRLPWKQYLEEYVDDRQHELLRQNVLLATRNFQHRVEVFRREVKFEIISPP